MNDTYDKRTIALHWASALLVLGLWTLGQCIDFFPKGAPRGTVRSLHIAFGAVLAVLLVLRLSWRARSGVKLPPADAGVAGKAAVGVHHLLYLLLLAVVTAGLVSVWFRGDTLFNLVTVPAFDPGNRQLAHKAVELHSLVANLLLGLAAAHGAAAVWHHRVRHDGVLRRMWPGLKAGAAGH